jgi:hypothetical protein
LQVDCILPGTRPAARIVLTGITARNFDARYSSPARMRPPVANGDVTPRDAAQLAAVITA